LKIETLVNLVGGELLNSPYISEVTSFTSTPESVTRGACFFVQNSEDIELAIKNGAYAVVSKDYENITDREIAWIKVDDLQKAILDVFKYENLKTEIYTADEVSVGLIKKMNLEERVVVLDTYKDLLRALNLTNKYLVTSDGELSAFFSNVKHLKPAEIELEMVTLFISRYKSEEINLPYVYKEEFSKALSFFEENSLKYTLEFEFERFRPVFVDHNFIKAPYGQTQKVLICGIKNDDIFFKELNYVIQNTKHAKTVIVNEKNKELLKGDFNFAMLVDFDVEVAEKKEEGKLF